MARLEPPRRVGDKLEVMGGDVPLVKRKDGAWDIDLAGVEPGGLASRRDIWRPVKAEYAVVQDGFAPLEMLEGIYSAHEWLDRHEGRVRRYLRSRFVRGERDGKFLELYNHPTKLRHLVIDHDTPLDAKLDRIIKHIATEESLITSVAAARGGGKSVTTAVILDRCKHQYGRTIKMLDTRPKSVLPDFVERIVDLRAADQEDIIWIDEAADMFSHRKSASRGSIGLPALLARARHMGLTVVALAPSSGIMDKVFDVLCDAIMLKPGTMNQGTYGRSSESRIISQFPEMLPRQKEWGVFVSNLMPPTTFCLPYLCNSRDPSHKCAWECCIPSWWRPDMSRSQMSSDTKIWESPEHQELAIELLYWDNKPEQIAEIMAKRGCVMSPEEWIDWLFGATNGIHPRLGTPLRISAEGFVRGPRGRGKDAQRNNGDILPDHDDTPGVARPRRRAPKEQAAEIARLRKQYE